MDLPILDIWAENAGIALAHVYTALTAPVDLTLNQEAVAAGGQG